MYTFLTDASHYLKLDAIKTVADAGHLVAVVQQVSQSPAVTVIVGIHNANCGPVNNLSHSATKINNGNFHICKSFELANTSAAFDQESKSGAVSCFL